MSESPTRLHALPGTIPIFPLPGAMLLPHARLPLNIFEPRYLAMVESALANGRHIGMIQPDANTAPGPHGPALQRVGCLGRIVSFSEAPGGRYLITLLGLHRFTITAEQPPQSGYRRIHAAYADFTADALERDSPRAIELDRTALFIALAGYFNRRGIEADLAALQAMSDTVLVLTLAMACPFAPLEKQALLEAPTPTAQADTLLTLLRIDMHAANADDNLRPS